MKGATLRLFAILFVQTLAITPFAEAQDGLEWPVEGRHGGSFDRGGLAQICRRPTVRRRNRRDHQRPRRQPGKLRSDRSHQLHHQAPQRAGANAGIPRRNQSGVRGSGRRENASSLLGIIFPGEPLSLCWDVEPARYRRSKFCSPRRSRPRARER